MEKESSRREFLKASSTSGAAVAMGFLTACQTTGTQKAPAVMKTPGPNDTIRVGVVGLNGRGGNHIAGYLGLRRSNVQLVALCDSDEGVLQRSADSTNRRANAQLKTFTDVRDMLEDGEIDAISIATPNHWHSLMTIWACQAGKDVYVEKPLSHNIFEGRQAVNAARKYKRIVQHGTQIRSSKAIQEAIQMLNDGVIGEVYYAKGTCYKWRDTIGHTPDEPTPDGVHYDEWTGPADQRPFSKNRYHYNWHWHWAYGNGDIGNQGVHQMDVARWGLGVQLPDLVSSIGGHFMFKDDQETPNTMVSSMKYEKENKMLVFEVRHWITNDELNTGDDGNVVGNLFLGSEGMMVMPSYTEYRVYMGRNRRPGPSRNEGGDHYANFIEAVRSRKVEDLNADVEEGHYSSALCHLANTAYLTQRTLRVDRERERVIGDSEANALLTRNYREPYIVPKNV